MYLNFKNNAFNFASEETHENNYCNNLNSNIFYLFNYFIFFLF